MELNKRNALVNSEEGGGGSQSLRGAEMRKRELFKLNSLQVIELEVLSTCNLEASAGWFQN